VRSAALVPVVVVEPQRSSSSSFSSSLTGPVLALVAAGLLEKVLAEMQVLVAAK